MVSNQQSGQQKLFSELWIITSQTPSCNGVMTGIDNSKPVERAFWHCG